MLIFLTRMMFIALYDIFTKTFSKQIESATTKELFPTGKLLEPTVTKMIDDRLALGRDEMTIFIDSEGNPTQKYALTWTDIPLVNGVLFLCDKYNKVISILFIRGAHLLK